MVTLPKGVADGRMDGGWLSTLSYQTGQETTTGRLLSFLISRLGRDREVFHLARDS